MSKSPRRLAPAIRSLMLSMLLAAPLCACVQAPPVFLTASDCISLVPNSWSQGVPSAPLPADKTVGGWIAFGDAQTGQLDIANGRFSDAEGIVKNCEALLKKAGDAAQPVPWWQFWR